MLGVWSCMPPASHGGYELTLYVEHLYRYMMLARLSGEMFCEDGPTKSRCIARPPTVSEEPILHRVCDDAKEACFRVAVVPNARRGPSHEVANSAWGEASYLKSIFDNILEGNCTRPNGKRKTVVDGERYQRNPMSPHSLFREADESGSLYECSTHITCDRQYSGRPTHIAWHALREAY